MSALDAQAVGLALRATGDALARRGRTTPLRIVVAGGSAGMLAGSLRPGRVTTDCDVLWSGVEEDWAQLAAAAAEVAAAEHLAPSWLSRDCSMYAWCLPLGWQSRCQPVGRFGPLEVDRLSRFDLIASKVMGAPVRPHDLEDLRAMQPTAAELHGLNAHLDRLAAEDLDGRDFKNQRAIVESLGGGA